MDRLKDDTPGKLHQAIAKYLQSDDSHDDPKTFYDKARACAHSLLASYPELRLPRVPACNDDVLEGLQEIREWCGSADAVVDAVLGNLRPQAIRQTIGLFKKLRGIADSVLHMVNGSLRDRIRNETTAKHNARRKELKEQIEKQPRTGFGASSPIGIELEVEAQFLREARFIMPGENSEEVQRYLAEDPTFQDRLSQLHVHGEIQRIIEKINGLVGSNTPDGKSLGLYCKLKDISLEKQFEDVGYSYSLKDFHDVIFGNCRRLYSSIDSVIQTLEQVQAKAKQSEPPGESWELKSTAGGDGVAEQQAATETPILTVGGDRRIELIGDFCNEIDTLINYITNPDEDREASKTKVDIFGDQVNSLAQKIWPQISIEQSAWPYQPLDNWGYLNKWGEGIFAIPPEQKERLIARLQQWKDRALKDKSKIQEQVKVQIKQEGVLEPKAPESFQELLWIWRHGKQHWKLILSAIAIFVIWRVIAKFDLMSRLYSLIKDMIS